jgi:hypothetical protein
MDKKILVRSPAKQILLCLSLVPILLLHPSSFSMTGQEWWLPALLSVLTIVALVQILVRRVEAAWPWRLITFAQGMSVISRLMMLLPHVTVTVDGASRFDGLYVTLAVLSLALSILEIWYCDLPELRRPAHA